MHQKVFCSHVSQNENKYKKISQKEIKSVEVSQNEVKKKDFPQSETKLKGLSQSGSSTSITKALSGVLCAKKEMMKTFRPGSGVARIFKHLPAECQRNENRRCMDDDVYLKLGEMYSVASCMQPCQITALSLQLFIILFAAHYTIDC